MSEEFEREMLKELREIKAELIKTNKILENIGKSGVVDLLWKRK
jgi:hypothetical protein